jgi:hypothetical protein
MISVCANLQKNLFIDFSLIADFLEQHLENFELDLKHMESKDVLGCSRCCFNQMSLYEATTNCYHFANRYTLKKFESAIEIWETKIGHLNCIV